MKYDAQALKRLRARAGLRIDAFAMAAGMSENAVRLIERGVSIPRADSLASLAGALGVAVEEFFVEEG